MEKQTAAADSKKAYALDQLTAMNYALSAWQSVTAKTISSCFDHTRILEPSADHSLQAVQASIAEETESVLTGVKRAFSDMHSDISTEEVDLLGDTEDEEVHGGEGLEVLTEEQIAKDPEEDNDEEEGGCLSKSKRTAAKVGLKLALANITPSNAEKIKLLELMLDRTSKVCMKKRNQAFILKIN